jgi:hypothetical protein
MSNQREKKSLMMKLSFASAILPELSLKQVVQFAAGNGFATVELMCWPVGRAERRYAGVTHVDVTNFTQDNALRKTMRRASKRMLQQPASPSAGLAIIPTLLPLLKKKLKLPLTISGK